VLAKRQRRLPIVAKPAGEACRECPLRRAPCVPTEFNPPSRTKKRVMVIGEAPGRNEADAGKPFIGQSGRATMELLAELGYSREDVVWSNAALCWGKDSEVSKARKACSGRLDREIAEVDPDVILLLGGHALHSVMKTKSKPRIMRWRGTVIRQKTKRKTRLVFPMLHPAFIMRDAAKLYEPLIRMDFDRVDRLMRHGYEPPEKKEGRRIVLAKTVTAIERELATLEKEVAFDVETVGLGATSTRLICLAIADRHKSVVIPFSKSRSGVGKFFNGQHDRALRAINAALEKRIAITHNGPADHIVAERHGIFIKRGDTLLAYTFAAHMP
jgi:DNA polymerase